MSDLSNDRVMDAEKATLEKVNKHLAEAMEILRKEQTTPFSDAIVLQNMLSCTRAVGSAIASKVGAIKEAPHIKDDKKVADQVDLAYNATKAVRKKLDPAYKDATALADEMMKTAEVLMNGPFFVIERPEAKDPSDQHTIIALQ